MTARGSDHHLLLRVASRAELPVRLGPIRRILKQKNSAECRARQRIGAAHVRSREVRFCFPVEEGAAVYFQSCVHPTSGLQALSGIQEVTNIFPPAGKPGSPGRPHLKTTLTEMDPTQQALSTVCSGPLPQPLS
jgi:hypothetical protein